jgi:hypothetical protein
VVIDFGPGGLYSESSRRPGRFPVSTTWYKQARVYFSSVLDLSGKTKASSSFQLLVDSPILCFQSAAGLECGVRSWATAMTSKDKSEKAADAIVRRYRRPLSRLEETIANGSTEGKGIPHIVIDPGMVESVFLVY